MNEKILQLTQSKTVTSHLYLQRRNETKAKIFVRVIFLSIPNSLSHHYLSIDEKVIFYLAINEGILVGIKGLAHYEIVLIWVFINS